MPIGKLWEALERAIWMWQAYSIAESSRTPKIIIIPRPTHGTTPEGSTFFLFVFLLRSSSGAALARRRAFLFVARSSSAQQQELSFIWARASAAAFRSDGGASTDNTHARADRIQARAATHRSPLPSGRLSGKTASIAQRSARVDRKLRGVKVGKRKLSMVLSLQQACDRRLASATSARAPVTLGEQSSAA